MSILSKEIYSIAMALWEILSNHSAVAPETGKSITIKKKRRLKPWEEDNHYSENIQFFKYFFNNRTNQRHAPSSEQPLIADDMDSDMYHGKERGLAKKQEAVQKRWSQSDGVTIIRNSRGRYGTVRTVAMGCHCALAAKSIHQRESFPLMPSRWYKSSLPLENKKLAQVSWKLEARIIVQNS